MGRAACAWFRLILIVASVVSPASLAIAQNSPLPPKNKPLKTNASDAFFDNGEIPRLKIEIAPEEMQKLRANPRAYAKAKVTENDAKEYREIGIKCKGAAGSFRGIDDRPALTLNFDKFIKKLSFHDLDKIHLNNSVQDGTYLHELISGDISLAAGVPAARATHARVWLNGRDLGFYGLKEGFDKKFLERHFADPSGNLYDGGFCQDIDANLEKDGGKGVDDRSDLKALIAACREPDPAVRWQKVEEKLDVDAFLSFMAVELMMCHWDGYCNNRNNYRVYFHPANNKAYFFPHGMDQMFGDSNFNAIHPGGALVAQAVIQNPEWRSRYRERLDEILKVFSPPDRLQARIDQASARMRPAMATVNPDFARQNEGHAKNVKDRLVARANTLQTQLATADPKPLKFDAAGIAPVPKWYPRTESPDARHEEVQIDGVKALSIAAGPSGQCVASWRSKVLLAGGVYELRARVRTAEVIGTPGGPGAAAGVRVSGGQRTNQVDGSSAWQVIKQEIQVAAPMQEIELVAELRAAKGQVWFDAGSLQLAKISK